jgi:hypothetical protein
VIAATAIHRQVRENGGKRSADDTFRAASDGGLRIDLAELSFRLLNFI